MRLTRARFAKIEGLLNEIGALWGEEDAYIEQEATRLRDLISDAAKDMIDGHLELLCEREGNEA